RERNDRKSKKPQGFRPRGEQPRPGRAAAAEPQTESPPARPERPAPPRRVRGADADHWLWGRHAVLAALANPERRGAGRLLATEERAAEILRDGLAPHGPRPEIVDGQTLARMLPPGAVHQ